MQRGLGCLAGFAQRLRGLSALHVRAVATQTLREAKNRDAFLARARTVLGLPIEVISGREEARLIYAGVARLQPSDAPRLVVDIGGRSTEMILGQRRTALRAESFQVGCVSLSMKYFGEGRFTDSAFRAAQVAAGAELEEALEPFAARHWQEALGCLGHRGRGIADACRQRRHRRPHHARRIALVHRAMPARRPCRAPEPARPEGRSPRRPRRRAGDPLHAGGQFRHRRAAPGARRPASGRDLRPAGARRGDAGRRGRPRPARRFGARAAAAFRRRHGAGAARADARAEVARRFPAAHACGHARRGRARAGVGRRAARARHDGVAPRPPSPQRLSARPCGRARASRNRSSAGSPRSCSVNAAGCARSTTRCATRFSRGR